MTAAEPEILFLIGEVEYGTAQSLPAFAQTHLPASDYKTTIVNAASGDRKSPDCHRFPGLVPALQRADLLVLSTRRRFPAKADMQAIRAYIAAGKPLVVLRTASHAFQARRSGTGYTVPLGHSAWNDFDQQVLGADYNGHIGGGRKEQALLRRLPEQAGSLLFRGVDWQQDVGVSSSLYVNRHLADDAQLLLTGHLTGKPETHQPVAWTLARSNRVFATSLGGRDDFATDWFPPLLANAIKWGLEPRPANTEAVSELGLPSRRDKIATARPKSAAASAKQMFCPDDLEVELVLSEPQIAQPNFINFDERGRLWMIEYRQYPEPAGLTAMSRDKHWRTTYDKVPHPPGHLGFVAGKDRITIHSDTTGDGTFDHMDVFLDGLNLATGLAHDAAGTWVLQPPYLLFYPHGEKTKPHVHLSGFGLHDTHSIATALTWGPDGWLYGCHGSTVTSDVQVEGKEGVTRSVGQNIWRYHPGQRVYDVFAEGGGNIWSCEFDAVGRVFAGANGGSPAFHYVQGGYYAKTFRKHGALSNPHTYGYLRGIEHPGWQRVSCNVFIYDGLTLPARYRGALFAANPIQGWLSASRLEAKGLNFRGTAIDAPANSRDRWFRPVIADEGPDGAVYLADWYDSQVNHVKHQEGALSVADGRLYRVQAKGAPVFPSFDLREYSAHQLVDLLSSRSKWWRETAQRLLRTHSDRAAVATRLRTQLKEPGQLALESLWALNGIGLSAADLNTALRHPNPHVRRWAIRLIGEGPVLGSSVHQWIDAEQFADLLRSETDLEVRAQAAATAKRLTGTYAQQMISALIAGPSHSRHSRHPDLDLFIWWAVEAHCATDAEAVVERFAATRLAPNLVRRLALERPDLLGALFEHGPDKKALLAALQEATRGQSLAAIPKDVLQQMVELPDAPLALRLQLGDPDAVAPALARLGKAKDDEATRQLVRVFGERPVPRAAPALSALLLHESEALRLAALQALPAYPDADIRVLFADKVDTGPTSQAIASATHSLLSSRPEWAKAWLQSGVDIPVEAIARIRQLKDPELDRLLPEEHAIGTTATEIARIKTLLRKPGGDPYKGMTTFVQRCGTCHKLFDRGADNGGIGPDLTAYQRNDLDSLLPAILDPAAEIREGYETYTLKTTDGRTLHGFLTRESNKSSTLRSLAGNDITVSKAEIKSLRASGVSIMPAGLLAGLDDSALRDLFSYLRTMQPMNVKK